MQRMKQLEMRVVARSIGSLLAEMIQRFNNRSYIFMRLFFICEASRLRIEQRILSLISGKSGFIFAFACNIRGKVN